MSFLTRLLLVTLLVGSCVPQNAEDFILHTVESIAARQDRLLQKFDELDSKIERKGEEVTRRLTVLEDYMNFTREELVSKFSREEQYYLTMTAHFNELTNLKRSTDKCLITDNINTFHSLLSKDECLEGRPSCSASATCKDGIGHYKCVCMSGYSGDGLTCQDINECTEVTNICGEGGICINHPGTYGCLCQIGFIEINNFCIKDINECETNNHLCHEYAKCTNIRGGYTCECLPYYYGDGFTCNDTNECESTNHLCHEYAKCTNTIGGYTCECLPKYYGDGFTCNEIMSSNCKELLDSGVNQSAVYTITPEGFPGGVKVYCDQETAGGGWNVILWRQKKTHQVNFKKTFEEYASGFGDPNGEVWIGNRVLHSMTGEEPFTLRVDATNLEGESRTGIWQTFSVGSEYTEFTLAVADYSSSSTLGDGLWKPALHWHPANVMKFSTIDRDNDEFGESCAAKHNGGWWYNACAGAHPTAPFGDKNGDYSIANWRYWESSTSNSAIAISEIQFLIRP